MVRAGEGDAGVLAPVPGAPLGAGGRVDGTRWCGRADPDLGAAHAVAEAARNVRRRRRRPVVPHRLPQLRAARGSRGHGRPRGRASTASAGDAAPELPARRAEPRAGAPLPFVSGNVSLYNQDEQGAPCRRRRSSPASGASPTCRGARARLQAGGRHARCSSAPPRGALGGSLRAGGGACAGRRRAAALDLAREARRRSRGARRRDARGRVRAAHDVSDGGLVHGAGRDGARRGAGRSASTPTSRRACLPAGDGARASRVVLARSRASCSRSSPRTVAALAGLGVPRAALAVVPARRVARRAGAGRCAAPGLASGASSTVRRAARRVGAARWPRRAP